MNKVQRMVKANFDGILGLILPQQKKINATPDGHQKCIIRSGIGPLQLSYRTLLIPFPYNYYLPNTQCTMKYTVNRFRARTENSKYKIKL